MRTVIAAALLTAASAALAQTWPNQPIKFIVSQSAGGSIDIAARLIGQRLSTALGQQVVVDNRAGANGMIAGEAAARANADGYTFLMTSPSALTINQHVYKKVPYDALRDFTPVTQTTSIVFALVVNAASPHRSVADLVAAARAKPEAVRYASAGIGNQSHLAGEVFAAAAGVQLLHVAYKGEAPAITDLLGGQVDMIFGTAPALLPHVRSGKLRALAVGQLRRSNAAPDVPAIAEAGYPSVAVTGWTGIVAPAGTPPAIVRRLHEEVVKVLAIGEVREALAKAGAEPVGSTPEQFAEFIRSETQKWGAAVKRAGIVPE
ncbi:MAG: tripartite tricarboxylate transporter substrate binding protein [Burkholderiales bacterium]|nr:tripartite tricarboxylate transporter substrate binding protein [Burkholderiales bacterium]